MLKNPDGYTARNMPKGWMKPVANSSIKRLKKENQELKTILQDVLHRLEKVEKTKRKKAK